MEKTIQLYPNPVYNDALVLPRSVPTDPVDINVFNAQGDLVYHQSVDPMTQETALDLAGLANGIYQVQIVTRDETLTKKIVIVR